MAALAPALEKISGQNYFLTLRPDVADFTGNAAPTLQIRTANLRLDVPIPDNGEKLCSCGLISFLAGKEEKKPIVIGWNLKNLYSYVLGKTKQPLHIHGIVYDLAVLEWYIGIEGKAPETFMEAAARLRKVTEHPSWGDLKTVYESIYTPLLSKVIPDIETLGIVHRRQRKILHSHYEIVGQVNGRLKCSKGYSLSFNPHSLDADEAQFYRPPFIDDCLFMYLDFNHMEVTMLQWLSRDPLLGDILASGQDVYCGIWKSLTGIECNDKFRAMCKDLFLPVVFGQGSKSVSQRLKVDENTAAKLVDRIYRQFETAMQWIRRRQKEIVNGQATDILGRCRTFEETEEYKIRNFVVQSPAALFCLDRLVKLHEAIKKVGRVGFHVHDGYMLFVPQINKREARHVATKVLESESDLFPDLQFKVSCQVGTKVTELEDWV